MTIIGFGSTETNLENKLEADFIAHVAKEYQAGEYDYYTDEFISKIEQWAEQQAKDSQAQSDFYKNAENFPDRYSRYWVNIVSDASHIVFILKIHHINRRHALSPDGWAMLANEKLIHISTSQIDDIKRRAREMGAKAKIGKRTDKMLLKYLNKQTRGEKNEKRLPREQHENQKSNNPLDS